MIQLRKNAFSEQAIDIPFTEGERISALVERVILTNGYELNDKMVEHFQAVVNGHIVDRDLWTYIEVKETDVVLIAPRLSRGSGGQLFKQIAIIAIVAVASAFGQAWVGPTMAPYFVAAVAIGSTLALNALIPPPGLAGLGGLGGLGSSFEGSQMYTITGQNNNAKKFGYVPRAYGTHRMFPIIAANPYTEIEADASTGTLVQFFYCIYDFGFGPLDIQEIKIGDTNITDFGDTHYRLVDLNKPAVSTGPWDDQLHDNFAFYKGDVERDGTSVAIDRNQSDSTAFIDDYQVTRFASEKVNDADQEITLDFVCPLGLVAYSTIGTQVARNIDLFIEFQKVGDTVWRTYNDLDYVYDSNVAGGSNVYATKTATVLPIDENGIGGDWVSLDYSNDVSWWWENEIDGISTGTYTNHDGDALTPKIKMVNMTYESYGYPKGITQIALKDGEASVRDAILIRGNVIGYVASITASPYTGYSYYVLSAPTTVAYKMFQVRIRFVESIEDEESKSGPTFTRYEYDRRFLGSDSLTDKVAVKYLSAGIARITANNPNPVYATVKFKPKEKAQYKVRITRKNSFSTYSFRTQDKLTLSSLSTRFDRNPILTDKRHVFLEVRVRATNQLNGTINNLSAIVESVLDVWDGSAWVKQKTNNPAWVFTDLITGICNKRALDKSRLHTDSLLEWANFCDAIPTPPPSQSFVRKRFECNFVLDFDTTLQSILNAVSNAAQASLNIIDGKYGVLIDKLRTVPVQIFTPRNSWDFNSNLNYAETPHAIKIRYVDPVKNWDIAEVTVYDNGYDEDNSTEFDELSTFACTNQEQAWRFGRYMLAQSRLRRERITLSVDFEHLVCTRGDYVQITQDIMRVGGRPARVKSVTGIRVKIDDAIDTLVDVDYGYVYRGADGIKTNTLTVVDSDEFDLDGDLPAVGDLIVIGEVGLVVFDCIVRSITPNGDLSATIELVEKADDIYVAESSDIIPVYEPQLTLNVDSNLAIPPAVEELEVVENTWRVVGGAYEYYIDLDWELPTGAAFEQFEVYVDSGSGYNLWDFTQESSYEYIVNENNLDVPHSFKVLAVSSTGKKIPLIEAMSVSATPLRKVTPPSNVLALYINITAEVLQLDWPAVADSDLDEYLIRFSPLSTGASWEASIPFLRADKNLTLSSAQARTGTYFIKAKDLNGNESLVPAQAITTIPNLFGLNIIQETNDFPDLDGQLVTTEDLTGGLTLKKLLAGGVETNQYYPEGYYYYKDFLDLGEIYTVRLQSLILAEGFTVADLMSNWDPLSDVLALSNAGSSEWDVETHYRGTDQLNVMSEWDAMSDIDPISEGSPDIWTPWTKFTMGDATARVFQFRLKLISNAVNVTPRVFDGVIRADMPDRGETYNNLTAPAIGLDVVYDPAFAGPNTSPNIQITQDNASQGDYYIIENKTLNGFKITFYNKFDVAVIRQFDAAVRGYGRKALAVI